MKQIACLAHVVSIFLIVGEFEIFFFHCIFYLGEEADGDIKTLESSLKSAGKIQESLEEHVQSLVASNLALETEAQSNVSERQTMLRLQGKNHELAAEIGNLEAISALSSTPSQAAPVQPDDGSLQLKELLGQVLDMLAKSDEELAQVKQSETKEILHLRQLLYAARKELQLEQLRFEMAQEIFQERIKDLSDDREASASQIARAGNRRKFSRANIVLQASAFLASLTAAAGLKVGKEEFNSEKSSLLGCVVTSVENRGAAQIAGIQPGHVLLRMNGIPCNNSAELLMTFQHTYPGDTVICEVCLCCFAFFNIYFLSITDYI